MCTALVSAFISVNFGETPQKCFLTGKAKTLRGYIFLYIYIYILFFLILAAVMRQAVVWASRSTVLIVGYLYKQEGETATSLHRV